MCSMFIPNLSAQKKSDVNTREVNFWKIIYKDWLKSNKNFWSVCIQNQDVLYCGEVFKMLKKAFGDDALL